MSDNDTVAMKRAAIQYLRGWGWMVMAIMIFIALFQCIFCYDTPLGYILGILFSQTCPPVRKGHGRKSREILARGDGP